MAFFIILMFGQPIIIGYVAAKQLSQVSAGVFWGIVACILFWSLAFLFQEVLHRPPFFLGGELINRDLIPEFARLLIAAGLSSAIVLVILTILPKKDLQSSP